MNIVPKFFVTFLDIPKYDDSGVDETLPADENAGVVDKTPTSNQSRSSKKNDPAQELWDSIILEDVPPKVDEEEYEGKSKH